MAVWQARGILGLGSIFPLVTGTTLLLASLAVFARGLTAARPRKSGPCGTLAGMRNSLALIAVLIVWALDAGVGRFHGFELGLFRRACLDR